MIGRPSFRLSLAAATALVLGAAPAPDGTVSPGGGVSLTGVEGAVGSAPPGTVVYLVGAGLDVAPAPAAPAVLSQEDITYVPHVLPVVAGTTVEIRNGDAILHNVHTRSRLNRPFNKSQLAGATLKVSFDEPEAVAVSCDVHSQMSATIVVVPNPFFTTVAPNGSYRIENVPPGSYELVAWHEERGEARTQVTIEDGSFAQPVLDFQNIGSR